MAIQKIELSAALNSLATQNNMDKLTGVLDGAAGNISKANLASVVADILRLANNTFELNAGESNTIEYGAGALLLIRSGVSNKIGLYSLPATGTEFVEIVKGGGYESYYSINTSGGRVTITNVSSVNFTMWLSFVKLPN